jgi:hypothetical protein
MTAAEDPAETAPARASRAPSARDIARVRADLAAAYARHARWHAAVDAYRAGTGGYPSLRALPSKAHKHRMYATASLLIRLTGTDRPAPRNLADIAALLADVAALDAAPTRRDSSTMPAPTSASPNLPRPLACLGCGSPGGFTRCQGCTEAFHREATGHTGGYFSLLLTPAQIGAVLSPILASQWHGTDTTGINLDIAVTYREDGRNYSVMYQTPPGDAEGKLWTLHKATGHTAGDDDAIIAFALPADPSAAALPTSDPSPTSAP